MRRKCGFNVQLPERGRRFYIDPGRVLLIIAMRYMTAIVSRLPEYQVCRGIGVKP